MGFGSFDASPLGGFIESPLGARGPAVAGADLILSSSGGLWDDGDSGTLAAGLLRYDRSAGAWTRGDQLRVIQQFALVGSQLYGHALGTELLAYSAGEMVLAETMPDSRRIAGIGVVGGTLYIATSKTDFSSIGDGWLYTYDGSTLTPVVSSQQPTAFHAFDVASAPAVYLVGDGTRLGLVYFNSSFAYRFAIGTPGAWTVSATTAVRTSTSTAPRIGLLNGDMYLSGVHARNDFSPVLETFSNAGILRITSAGAVEIAGGTYTHPAIPTQPHPRVGTSSLGVAGFGAFAGELHASGSLMESNGVSTRIVQVGGFGYSQGVQGTPVVSPAGGIGGTAPTVFVDCGEVLAVCGSFGFNAAGDTTTRDGSAMTVTGFRGGIANNGTAWVPLFGSDGFTTAAGAITAGIAIPAGITLEDF